SVERVSQSLQHVIKENAINLIRRIPQNLRINTIPSYLDGILLQLISNAIRYGTNEESKIIEIEASRYDQTIQISIVDHGNGFDSMKYKEQLFTVGARFRNSDCNSQGLGLFIVRQQVGSLNGSIDITSQVDKGTRVLM